MANKLSKMSEAVKFMVHDMQAAQNSEPQDKTKSAEKKTDTNNINNTSNEQNVPQEEYTDSEPKEDPKPAKRLSIAPDKKFYSLRIDREVYEKIKQLSSEEYLSVNQFIMRAIREDLKRREEN